MEKQHTEDVFHQMSKFTFDKPFKVSVILEEDETDDLNASLDKRTNYTIPSASTMKLNTEERELPNGSTKTFSDAVSCIMENNILNTEYDKYCGTRQQVPNVINDENNYDHNSRQEKTFQNVFNDNGENLPENIAKRNILKMLDSVSYNIIGIWKCYHTIKPYESKINKFSEATAKMNFLKYKHYCYDCSYIAVNLLIIPREDNQIFIEKFINRTIILARHMGLFQISREFLLETIKDMIYWSKHSEQNKINLERKVQNEKPIQSSKNNIDKICIFTGGSEDRKLSISIAPEILKEHVNFETGEDAHKYKQQKQTNRGKRNSLADNASDDKSDDNYNFHRKRSRTNTNELSITASSAPQENVCNTVLLGNDSQTINLLTDYVNDQNPNAISRSSISRDSGFVSPVYRPPSRDPMTSTQDCINNHVIAQTTCCGNTTSPNDALVIVAACRVCSTETHRMCLGCVKEYYCSKECQRKDWPRHQTQCQ